MRRVLIIGSLLVVSLGVGHSAGPTYKHEKAIQEEFRLLYSEVAGRHSGVGDYVEATLGSTAYPATTVWGDLTSISITKGDWDVQVFGMPSSNGGTYTNFNVGVSTTAGNSAAGMILGVNNRAHFDTAATASVPSTVTLVIPQARFSVQVETTVYFKMMATYSAGAPDCRGKISAVRIR